MSHDLVRGSEQSPPQSSDVTVTYGKQIGGAAVTGVLAAAAMYAALAVAALVQGRSALYPLYAVHAMMSGRRVLPDYPYATVRGPQPLDYLVAPLYFLAPAMAVALLTGWWLARHNPDLRLPSWRAALVPAAVGTAVGFVLLVGVLGYWELPDRQQRTSSGFGVRALGMTAWVTAHVVYVAVLAAVLPWVTRAVATERRRSTTALRGETPDQGAGG